MTGSNVAMVFKDGETIYHEVCNSGKDGDRELNEGTPASFMFLDERTLCSFRGLVGPGTEGVA